MDDCRAHSTVRSNLDTIFALAQRYVPGRSLCVAIWGYLMYAQFNYFLHTNAQAETFIVTFNIPAASPTTIMLSQADTRFWEDISGSWSWSMDFLLFRRDSECVLGRSSCSSLASRSVTLAKDLEAGDYVLHVSDAGPKITTDSWSVFQVRLDRQRVREKACLQLTLATRYGR
jgi:hypothetical protein